MTYTAVLWACVLNRDPQGQGDSGVACNGFRYLEVGEEPGQCGQPKIRRSDYSLGPGQESKCPAFMYKVGEFELEEEEDDEDGQVPSQGRDGQGLAPDSERPGLVGTRGHGQGEEIVQSVQQDPEE